jgi:hypothetical protein
MRRLPLAWCLVAAALAASCDPVHEQQIDALGGETPGVPRGPLHRPGQPCIVCHDGALGDPPAFSIAGTIFQDGNDTTPLDGATVSITSVDGSLMSLTTNAAGNFYASAGDYTPKYPLHVSLTSGGSTIKMTSHIGGNGSCAFCHSDPSGPSSPGHVYFDVPNGIAP